MKRRAGTDERRAQLYREALELMQREYSSSLHVEGVARRLATSRRQLQRAFAEAGGTSFRDALIAIRMHHARRLLARYDMSVREVAANVGYPQPAQFAKSFRRHHDEPPSSFRRRAHSKLKVAGRA
jgi:AraC family transcriptional regulator, regulatory protein of adaptative response / methylphosphotriester-DNA alkyltransferase methyltransferase